MVSHKIFPVIFEKCWDDVSNGLSLLSYNDQTMRGLVLKNISNVSIEGIYYEKLAYTETIYHPLGGIETIVRETYLHTNFIIFREAGILVVKNPGKKFLSLFSFISVYGGDLIHMRSQVFDIYKFCLFCKDHLSGFKIKQINFLPYNILPQCIAKISISSLNDAIEDAANVNIILPKEFKKISFECAFNTKKLVGSVNSTGLLVFSNHAGIDFLEAIKVQQFFKG